MADHYDAIGLPASCEQANEAMATMRRLLEEAQAEKRVAQGYAASRDKTIAHVREEALRNLTALSEATEEIADLRGQIVALTGANNDLRAAVVRAERDESQAITERDDYHEIADKLSDAIARLTGTEIGEHSSANDPWQNALDAVARAENDLSEDWHSASRCGERPCPGCIIEDLVEQKTAAEGAVARAEQATAEARRNVEKLHGAAHTDSHGAICSYCTGLADEGITWPCRTLRALGMDRDGHWALAADVPAEPSVPPVPAGLDLALADKARQAVALAYGAYSEGGSAFMRALKLFRDDVLAEGGDGSLSRLKPYIEWAAGRREWADVPAAATGETP